MCFCYYARRVASDPRGVGRAGSRTVHSSTYAGGAAYGGMRYFAVCSLSAHGQPAPAGALRQAEPSRLFRPASFPCWRKRTARPAALGAGAAPPALRPPRRRLAAGADARAAAIAAAARSRRPRRESLAPQPIRCWLVSTTGVVAPMALTRMGCCCCQLRCRMHRLSAHARLEREPRRCMPARGPLRTCNHFPYT